MTRRNLLQSRFKNAYSRMSYLTKLTHSVTINVPTFKAWDPLHYFYLRKLRRRER